MMTRYPQVLVNVRVEQRPDLEHAPAALGAAVREAEARLGEEGRALVRASGTEPVVRVMVEAASQERADDEAARLVAAVEAVFGGS
jgi:phosphoglucosamine mutase